MPCRLDHSRSISALQARGIVCGPDAAAYRAQCSIDTTELEVSYGVKSAQESIIKIRMN